MGSIKKGYSVAEMYSTLCDFPYDDIDVNWQKIWKLNVSERVRHFMWMLKHDRLLTNCKKSRMGLGHSMCAYCGDVEETSLHALRDCPLVLPLWKSLIPNEDNNQFFMSNLDNWINLNVSHDTGWRGDRDWKDIWAITCHCLWTWRNKELHENNFVRPINL
jgi:hypothetical protein